MKSIFSFGLLIAFTVISLLYPIKTNAYQEGEPALVILSANWCAKCRDLNTVVPNVLSQLSRNDIKVITLDADNESTPQVAKRYGIRLEGSDLPQVYLYNQGRTSLILNSQDYGVGHPEQAEAKLMSGLSGL